MTRSELLDKTLRFIARCEADSSEILTWEFLSKEDKEKIEKIHTTCVNNRLSIEGQKETISEEKLKEVFNRYYDTIYPSLRAFQQKKEKVKVPVSEPVKKEVKPESTAKVVPGAGKTGAEASKKAPEKAHVKVVSEEKQTDKEKTATKKGKNWWKYLLTALGSAGLTAFLIFALKGCNKDIKTTTEATTLVPSSPAPIEQTITDEELQQIRGIDNFDADDINFDDYSSLVEAAKTIQDAMPEDEKIPLEQIQYALVFGNLDQFSDEKQGSIFREPEEVFSATYQMGQMLDNTEISADDLIKGTHPVLTEQELLASLVNVTDLKLTIDNFADAKVEGGYDLYKVLELCGSGMDIKGDDDLAFNYAATMNDIVSQVTRNFTMPANATEEQWSYIYTTLGIYNANRDRILELTSGRHLSTIYGTGIRNDGSYGDICVEELLASSAIYNKNGTYCGPGKVVLYKDAEGYEWPEGYVYEKDGKYYTDFVTARDESGEATNTETIEVTYSREVDPSAFLAVDGDYMNAICDINNTGISR